MTDLLCDECGRSYIEEPCGFPHSLMRMRLALIRQMVQAILSGGRRG